MGRDGASGFIVGARSGDKHLLFQRRNHSFTGADFRNNSGFQRRVINTDDNFIDHLLRKLLHAAGRDMLREKCVLVVTRTGHHVYPAIPHQIEHELRVAPHIAVGHFNDVAHAQRPQIFHLLTNEIVLI